MVFAFPLYHRTWGIGSQSRALILVSLQKVE